MEDNISETFIQPQSINVFYCYIHPPTQYRTSFGLYLISHSLSIYQFPAKDIYTTASLSSGRDISALIRYHPSQGFNDKRTVKYMSHSYYYSYQKNPSQSNPLPIDMRFYFVSPRILPIKPTGWNLCRIRIPVIKWSIIHHARE